MFYYISNVTPADDSPQKAALEVHDAQGKQAKPTIEVQVDHTPEASEAVCFPLLMYLHYDSHVQQTVKANNDVSRVPSLLSPPTSQSRATGTSVKRGDLDEAIRSMRTGRRRARIPNRPLSKIFVDGARTSRIFD